VIDTTLANAIQEQFNRERANEIFYQAVADWLAGQYWPGFEAWFRRQAEDERSHARRLANYLVDQNITPVYAGLAPPEFDPGDPMTLFTQALAKERTTTADIDQLYHLSEIQESPATCELMLWFVKEQVEEERTIVDMLQALGRADCPAAVLILDREQLQERS
jgi:ferritin